MCNLDCISKLSQIVLGVIGLYAIYISHNQLKLARRNTQLNIAKNEIDIFARLNEKEKVFIDCLEIADNDTDLLNHAKEEYFRLFDTVCLYVLNESITLDNFHNQYKDRLNLIVREFADDFKQDLYANIMEVYNNLKEKK